MIKSKLVVRFLMVMLLVLFFGITNYAVSYGKDKSDDKSDIFKNRIENNEEDARAFLEFLEIGFSVRTNPPITLGNWNCNCKMTGCECSMAGAMVYLVWDEIERFFWPKYADRGPFGHKICAEKCVLHISRPVRVKADFITTMLNKQNIKSITAIKRQNQAQEELVNSIVRVTKEKDISRMKQEAKSLGVDLTTYFVFQLAEKIYGKLTPATVMEVVEELLDLVSRGKIR